MIARATAFTRSQWSALCAEERLNSVTHGFGLAAASLGGLALVLVALWSGDMWRAAGASIYAASLVFLFAASTAYHGAVTPRWKRVLRKVDHAGIMLLIAGSYTPFVLTSLRESAAVWAGAVVWGLLGLGLFMQWVLSDKRYYQASLLLYLAMGFCCVPFGSHLVASIPDGALLLLGVGGALYVIGVGFFVWESLPYSHGVWHLFVLAGAGAHYIAVMRYVALG